MFKLVEHTDEGPEVIAHFTHAEDARWMIDEELRPSLLEGSSIFYTVEKR